MRVWNGIESLDAGRSRVVATIGNYDGVHRGHRAILDHVLRDAREAKLPAALITFDPHPLTVIAPERRPDLVQTRGQKLRSLEEAGLGEVFGDLSVIGVSRVFRQRLFAAPSQAAICKEA